MLGTKILLIVICAGLLVGIIVALQAGTREQGPQKAGSGSSIHALPGNGGAKKIYSLAFFLKFGTPQYETNLKILAKNLRSGDYLLLYGSPASASDIVRQAQDMGPIFKAGVDVIPVVEYRNVKNLTETVPTLPRGIGYVMYDYEGGRAFSPEFTKDEKKSIGYFDAAKQAVLQYDEITGSSARLFATPPYGELRKADWNWGLVSSHVDVIDMQLQGFLKDPALKNYSAAVIKQIRSASPGEVLFIQLSINPKRGTLQENVDALNSLSSVSGISAFLVYYLPSQSSDLEQFFGMLDR